jgi:hypothetical protein
LEERLDREITFPRLVGYRYDLPEARLEVKFTEDSRLTLSAADLPTKTENAPIIGESVIHNLDELKKRREQEVAFLLAKLTLEKYFRQDGEKNTEKTKKHKFDSEVQSWRFPRLLEITRQWLATCVRCKDNTFPQLLLLLQFAHDAADKIYKAIVASTPGEKALKPILRPYDTVGSTQHVDFDTTKPTYAKAASAMADHVLFCWRSPRTPTKRPKPYSENPKISTISGESDSSASLMLYVDRASASSQQSGKALFRIPISSEDKLLIPVCLTDLRKKHRLDPSIFGPKTYDGEIIKRITEMQGVA